MMDSTSISALSVLGGSLVGALTSLASTWLTQQHQDRRELLGEQLADRETLYACFISEASRALIDSLDHSLDNIGGLSPLYALFGRIRLSSSEPVVIVGEKVIKEIVAGYFRPNLTKAEFHEIAFGGQDQRRSDPLAEFSMVCRDELRALAESGGYSRAIKRASRKQKANQPSPAPQAENFRPDAGTVRHGSHEPSILTLPGTKAPAADAARSGKDHQSR
jgi:hypothetical protein